MIKEFKEFIIRGNVVDLAVAVVIGAAFTAVVNSFTNDIFMQLIAAIFGKPDFNDISILVSDTEIYYGRFLTALVNFLIVAFVVFLVVKAINKTAEPAHEGRRGSAEETEVELLTEIRDALTNRSS